MHVNSKASYSYFTISAKKTINLLISMVLLSLPNSLLSSQTYEEWKMSKQESMHQDNFAAIVARLALNVEKYLNIDADMQHFSIYSSYNGGFQKTALYSYNFLREILNLKLIDSVDNMDHLWRVQVADEAFTYCVMNEEQSALPTTAQLKLANDAQMLLQLKDTIKVFSADPEKSSWCRSNEVFHIYIGIAQEAEFESQIFQFYHELGHAAHERTGPHSSSVEEFLNSEPIKADVHRLKQYVDLGRSAFDESTPVGKLMHGIDSSLYCSLRLWLASKSNSNSPTPYWSCAYDKEECKKILRERIREYRADLYACDTLFTHNQIGLIVHMLATQAYALQKWQGGTWACFYSQEEPAVIAEDEYTHPSYLERALYIAGFLVDKGIDINAALKEWFARGKCVNSEGILFFEQKTQGAKDFLKAYHRHELQRKQAASHYL